MMLTYGRKNVYVKRFCKKSTNNRSNLKSTWWIHFLLSYKFCNKLKKKTINNVRNGTKKNKENEDDDDDNQQQQQP